VLPLAVCLCDPVASRAEAWIEIIKRPLNWNGALVASRAEAWIEIISAKDYKIIYVGRLPRGGVD